MATATEQTLPKTPQSMSGTSNDGPDKQTESETSQREGENPTDNKPKKDPPGGFDATPIPNRPPGWTVKITFVSASNLPMADLNTLSSDPYVLAQINTGLPQRHKEDDPLRFRTHTIRRKTDPVWNSEWIVANVPSTGFKLKCRVYDEDPADHDDRLGNVHVNVDHIDENWPGIKEQSYSIKKRMGSKRAYVIRAVATCIGTTHQMHGELVMSVQVLGRTKDESGGRAYTVGPCWWVKHYSPMLGRITGMKEDKQSTPDSNGHGGHAAARPDGSENHKKGRKSGQKNGAQRYNFQANEMQLPGPVPAELYHRYVEFKPFIKGMFTHSGLRGYILNKALHHQHARVYNYDRSTVWGWVPPEDTQAISKRFLELTHYGHGGRLFTYVLTLDAHLRFTETGKEFGIDMLSKHSMHSDVSAYIAFSGEFFVRRYHPSHHKKSPSGSPHQPSSPDPTTAGTSHQDGHERHLSPDPSKPVVSVDPAADKNDDAVENANQTRGGYVKPDTPVAAETVEADDTPLDPSSYELIIDNDSGTYRPAAHLLPLLKTFLSRSLPGLHVRTLDCQADEEKMKKLKDEQREMKKQAQGGQTVVFTQRSRGSSFASSISSSDEEALDRVEGTGDRRLRNQVARDVKLRAKGRQDYWRGIDPRLQRRGSDGGEKEQEGRGKGETKQRDVWEGGVKGEGQGHELEEKPAREVGEEQDVTRDRKGTVMNQGQTIGSSDRHPEHHVEGQGQGG